ncbi:MAG TPA: glycosyltransferase [Phaeodactylibacter sp.]|nr:glycosyltransferase [Phaeodactylibacter sp.]
MIRICGSLQAAGYSVLLIGRKKKTSLPLEQRAFAQKRLSCFFEKGKLFYLEYNTRLFLFLLFQPFDVVCGIDLDTLLPALWVARLKQKKCTYDAHEYFTEVPEVVHRPFTKKVWSILARYAIPRVDAAYTVCHSLADIFYKKYGLPFEVIRNVPFRKNTDFAYAKSENKKVLLYQGVLNVGRGLPQLIEAMQEIDDAVLYLAGEGDLSTELRRQVQALGLSHKVKFLGYLRPAELTKATAIAYIGLNFLENKGLSYYYSLANKTFDYIQWQVPAIHMDFPEYRILNEQYQVAVLIPDLKKDTICSAIKTLLQDKSLYQKLKANTQTARLTYHWENEEKKLLSIYQKLNK